MGMDFVALLKYPGPNERLLQALDLLELASPQQVQTFTGVRQEAGQGPWDQEAPTWKSWDPGRLQDPRLERRPTLPTRKAFLQIPGHFSLTFGADCIEIYHLLRWHTFLTVPAIQQTMIDACLCLGHILGATDCILASDYSPVVSAARQEMPFDDALASATGEHGERPHLMDLLQTHPLNEIVRIVQLPDGGQQARTRSWDLDSPPPEGWERRTTWDSHGYWRLDLGSPSEASLLSYWSQASLDQARTSAPNTTHPTLSWAICQDPGVMLDHILKQETPSWRKIRLWACACLRRIWPLLTPEPPRQLIEIIERSVDGLADERALTRALAQAHRVKKGNRRANGAVCLAGELGSSTYIFPPANISGAVLNAIAPEDEASPTRATDASQHAELLRDIFGPSYPLVSAFDSRWRTPTVIGLARAIYQDRLLPEGLLDSTRLAILGDALEDAGCADPLLLSHCRHATDHVRGCWVIDLILDRT